MKKIIWIVGIVVLLAVLLLILKGNEDDWIKDSRGVWIKHGMPASIPTYVKEQQEIINCSLGLYEKALEEGINFSLQCLGVCENYAVDVVHVPRNAFDDREENQCEDFRTGKAKHFVELGWNSELVRIV